LLLFGIRRAVGHQHAVLVPCPFEHLGHFLGGADASPGLGGLLGQLEARPEYIGDVPRTPRVRSGAADAQHVTWARARPLRSKYPWPAARDAARGPCRQRRFLRVRRRIPERSVSGTMLNPAWMSATGFRMERAASTDKCESLGHLSIRCARGPGARRAAPATHRQNPLGGRRIMPSARQVAVRGRW
jgi:hypothetical protein